MGKTKKSKERIFLTPQSLNAAIKNMCDVLRRSNCAGAMQYIPELTWMLFLRILDEQETIEAENLSSGHESFTWSVTPPYRWRDWASPYEPTLFDDPAIHKPQGWKRRELEAKGDGALLGFINAELFPALTALKIQAGATPRQKIIGEIMADIGQTRIDTEYNLQEVLDKADQISVANIDPQHIFPLSQVYEGLLLRMGQKSNDGGQFFTPREVVRVMARVVDPQPGETIYDPCCGTGGFLVEACEHINQVSKARPADTKAGNKDGSFYGREKENLVYPLALANLVLHGIDEPHIWHGNTLTGQEAWGDLFRDAPEQFDVILTNPPFGGKESKPAQNRFAFKSSSTQVLFLQHVMDSLNPNGRCGIVVDEGLLFRTNDAAYAQTKQKLLETCNLWCIVSLPIGAFVNAGASVKTNLLFFTKGEPTRRVWYYDLSDLKLNKKRPLSLEDFGEFLRLLPLHSDSERSWSVTRQEVEDRHYDLKAVNPHYRVHPEDSRSLEELLGKIEKKNREVNENIRALRLSS